MIYKVGVTGGIGSGKSSVAKLFANLDVPTFSSDSISRELCEPDQEPYQAILSHFGKAILNADRTLNRSTLGDIVFNDSDQLKILESILHPAIFNTMHSRAEKEKALYCILDIPLLIGTREQDAVDRILVVDTSEELRVRRVQSRSGWTEEKTRSVIANQRPITELISAADDIISNDGNLFDLEPAIQTLHEKYVTLARLD